MKENFTKVVELLYLAKQEEVEIILNDDGRLQLKVADNKNIDESLLTKIRSNKESIIDFLTNDGWRFKKLDDTRKIIKVDRSNASLRIPLSFSQERLWFIDQLEGSLQYHITAVLRLKGKLNRNALENALNEIVNRHEILRTVYIEEDGQAWQFLKPKNKWKLKITSGLEYTVDSKGLEAYIQSTTRNSFDLSFDYMLRAELIMLTEEEHILVITMHHIASDAWSTPILVAEVGELYSSFEEGRTPNLSPLQLQYSDYAVWQRSNLQGELLDEKLSYWKKKLEDVVPLQLPLDYKRPAITSNRGSAVLFTVPPELRDKLRSISQQYGATLYMTLLAAFKVLLYRYSGQEDICVGTSIAGRPQAELEGLIGFFVNTLALRSNVDGKMQFTALLEMVRKTMLEAYSHQEVPFEKVVEAVVKDRDLSRNPLFQVMLVLRNTPDIPELRLGEISLSGVPYEHTTVKFDLTFFMTESPRGIQGSVLYSTDLFSRHRIEQMVEHFTLLLNSIVAFPLQRVGLLPMLSSWEERELLVSFNGSAVEYPRSATVVSVFEDQVVKRPGAVAVVFEGEVLTYEQLNERANRLAHYLRSCGVKEDMIVPVYTERSVEMVVAIVGILKAGAGYVPIDVDFPGDRIRYMIEDSGSTLVLSSKESRSGVELADAGVEIIETDGVAVRQQPSTNPVTGLRSDHLAYVIYTSGSTGMPKGVMIEHRSLLDYVFGLDQQTQIGQCKSYALVSTTATDLGNTVIYSSLLLGGALHIFTKEQVSNIEYLHDYFSDNRIDCLKIVPSHWKALHLDGALLLPKKLLVFGGEALSSGVVEDIHQSGSGCTVVNHYGPTETTIGKLLHVTEPGRSYNSTIPIGKPFSNTAVYILSKDLQLAPAGIPGQLYIAGEGVARGYLNNGELTAKKFISNPFSQERGRSVMYGTGDLVKYLPDGNIEFIGRVDDQVKIRGYRVELGEIETVLQQCERVRQAVVVAREDKQGNKRLVGYIVAAEGGYEREEILSYAREKLPEYMVPSVLVELAQLPLLGNGKVNRKALPDPEVTEETAGQYVAPRNDAEARLAEIWQEVLEEDRVGVHDDFFELGGHSLLAVRLVSAIRKEFVVEIPISHVFDYPTVALLAAALSGQSSAEVLPSIQVIRPRPERIPLSFSQERLWFIDRMEGSIQYHVPVVLKLQGKLDIQALGAAMQQIVTRHEVLRTVFRQQDGEAFQVIQENVAPVMQVVNASGFAQDAIGLENHIKQLIRVPFNLSEDCMLRAHLIVLGEEEYILVATLHHIASDGWSRSILVGELAELYASANEKRSSTLKLLPVQYADFALWQRNYLSVGVLEKKLAYWKGKLAGVLPLDLPTDYVRPAVQGTRGAVISFQVDSKLAASLQHLSQKHGATLYMTLLSAFNVLLARYSGQQDICVGTPIAGRQQQELEGLIGFFVNTLAMRSQVDQDASFTALLQQVKTTTMEGYANQEIPFEKVVEAVVKERDLSRNPLFQVMFILRNTPDVPELRLGDIALSRTGYEHSTSLFDFSLFITETENGLHGAIEYSTDLYTRATIERMAGHFTRLLGAIVARPEEKTGQLALLTAQEEQTLLSAFNATAVPYPADKSVADLFEEQAQETPLVKAIVFEGEELSYQELDKRSNQLAHYLRGKGVREGVLVPIFIERSVNMVIGVLGILKSGAAYVPVDPEYPSDRIAYMLADSAAGLVVTSSQSRSKLGQAAGIELVELDTSWPCIGTQSTDKVAKMWQPDHLVYVMYTSGSTGKPKGVRMGGRGMVNLLSWQQKQFNNENRHVLQFASLTFDVSFQEIFSTLCFGSTLYLINEQRRKDMSAMLQDISEYGITHLFVPYIVLKSLVEHLYTLPGEVVMPQQIIVAGEQLKLTEDIRELIKEKGITLVNQYGPTEAHVVSSYTIDPSSSPALPPIGKPIDNTQLYVTDAAGGLCPVGVAGELCIGGVQVAQGYLNREALTAEKFIEDRFSKREGARLYRTGDVARWLEDGNLEYLGRVDEQVKVRGYRIELGEIESVVQQSGLVSQGVVIARNDSNGHKRLVGYIVAAEKFDKQAITSYLHTQLPDYMVPSIWVEMQSMPITPNGKIDKRALPDPDVNELSSHSYVAPRTETEKKLAEIWQQLLGVEKVGIHDNFFELGGHSLMVMRVVAAIRTALTVEVQIKDVFNYSTIAQLAAQIESQTSTVLLPTIERAEPRPEMIPLSFSQERLWFLDRLEGSIQYHLPAVLSLKGTVNKEALAYALKTIVDRHEVLRTVFLEKEGQVYQKVKDKNQWSLSIKDDDVLKKDRHELDIYIQQLVSKPFNLSQDDMIRAELILLNNLEQILVVTLHHIASDGWSQSVLVKEIAVLYETFEKGNTNALPPLNIQYADYAIWQKNYLKDDILKNKISYWKDKLQGVEVLQLPTDYTRPPIQSTKGAVLNFLIEKEISNSLQELSQQQGSTLFMTLLAAFKVLLSRYSSQNDICVGIPTAGRQQQELEGLIGFFVNTLALRSEINDNDSFVQLLQKVKAATLEAYEHQDVPFEKVVDVVIEKRDMSRSPLFQVMFILQNAPDVPSIRLGDLNLSSQGTPHNTSKFDLTFVLMQTAKGLKGSVEYCVDLYTEQTVRRLVTHYKELLSSIVVSPEQKISLLPMLSIQERHQLLVEFNNTKAAYPTDKTIVDLFEDQALKHPEATAIVYEGEVLRYKELNERAGLLAGHLKSKGVTEEALVPICMNRGIELIVGILAILKAGAAYVPIDPNYPEERISFMIEDVSATIAITNQANKKKLSFKQGLEILEIDKTLNLNFESTENATVRALPHNTAYVIYTSGSTGIPKGVVIEHSSLVNLITWHIKEYEVTSASKATSMAGVGFDAFGWEIWPYLTAGASIYLIKDDKRLDTSKLINFFIYQNITHSFISTALIKDFLEESRHKVKSLKYLLSGGDKLLSVDLEGINYNLVNNYGPTEYTVVTSKYKVKQEDKKRTPPIGAPIANTTIYILDNQNELVPINVTGEICIAGAGLARGYLNREELTSSKFIQNPFGNTNGSRIYKTGDFGRWLPDGNIEYVGRRDEQVKVRGYRIELGEIENIMQKSGFVSSAVVVAREDGKGNKQLIGYVVAPQNEFDKQGLISYLQARLPEYMVPSVWVELERLPLTSNGKIDRKALPEPDVTTLLNNEYVAPRTETEVKLAQIWQEILGVERVGAHDNFFEMGGHSLLVFRLVSAIRKEFNVEIPIRDVFTFSTIAEFAELLQIEKDTVVLPAIQVAKQRPEQIPLSFSQERLWFIDRLEGSIQYHVPAVLRLKGRLNKEALSFALQTIVNRHEVLRTVFLEKDGKVYQQIQDKDRWQLNVNESFKINESEEDLRRHVQQLITRPFDLSKDHMIRAELIAVSAEEQILVVTLHHIASDGWSMSILIKEVVELYEAFDKGKGSILEPLNIQYADFALWQRSYIKDDVLNKKISYWKEKLDGVEPLQLPTDFARPTVQSTKGAVISSGMQKDLFIQLKELSQQQGTTLFMTLLAAFKTLLYRYTGQHDVCVGTPIAGRQQQEVESLIGFFVNTIALRDEVRGEISFQELLQQVKTTTLQAYDHQDVPFEKVVDAVVKERDISRSPLFQVMFVLQNNADSPSLHLGDVDLIPEKVSNVSSKFDITFFITETTTSFNVAIEYSTDRFKEDSINRMMDHYKELLSSIVKFPDKRISDLRMLTVFEEQQLLHEFNNTYADYPQDKTIVELFKEQVINTPEGIAAVYNGAHLSYLELDKKSNALANYLRKKGVKKDALIPVCMNRSLDLLVGILGILKAGAAYVPIDTKYPTERINYIIDDVQATIAITNKENISKFLGKAELDVLELDGIDSVLFEREDSQPIVDTNIASRDLAYVIYTSGSTGKPKGVMVEHGNVVSLVKGVDYISLSKEDILLSTGSPSFDATTFEYWGMLLNGGRLILCKDENLLDTQFLKNEIITKNVNKMWFTSSWFNQLADNEIDIFEGLETIIVGGEKLSEQHINRVQNKYKRLQIINGYGPTENTTFSLTYKINFDERTTSIPIGRPLSNRKAYLFDQQGKLVPIGVIGEIYLGGAGLSRGYLNNEALTTAKFISNPFDAGELLYKSGDLGKWLPNGNIEYLGRKDEQVKIRGYRIELGEIENVVLQSGFARQCVVVLSNEDGNRRLAGYIVAEGLFDKEGLNVYLHKHLPEYMIPSVWIELEAIPLTSNGKADKKALPVIDIIYHSTDEYVAPRNDLEIKLTEIWQELLGVERVGIGDNFFELGGDSILTIQIVSRVRRLGYEMQPKDLFIHQTIGGLSTLIAKRSVESILGEQGILHGACGLLPIQQWYFDKAELDISHFNQSVLLGIDKSVTEVVLREAVEHLMAHHDALRFQYELKGDAWYQSFGFDNGNLLIEDLRLSSKDQLRTSIKSLSERYQRSLDIQQGQLVRVVLIQTPTEESRNRLLIIIHHLAVDGVSWRILLEDLEILIKNLSTGEKKGLDNKGSSYRQWYDVLKQYGQSDYLMSQKEYWEKAPKTSFELPGDRKYLDKVKESETALHVIKLEAGETQQLLQEVPRVYQTEINDILICALARTLCEFSETNKVVIGLEGHGREDIAEGIDTSRTVGWFTTLYPLVLEGDRNTGEAEWINVVKKQLREVPDKGLGYGVLRYINKQPSLQKDCWEIVFNYLGQIDNVVRRGGVLTGSSESSGSNISDNSIVNEKMSVNSIVRGGQLIINWRYSLNHYDQETIKGLAQLYISHLQKLIVHCLQQSNKQSILNQVKIEANKIKKEDYGFSQVEESNSLIPMRKGKDKVPLYIVCGGGGTVFKFKKMVDLLDPAQPVFGLQQPTDLKNLEEFPETVEEIAARYVSEIMLQNPDGPYALSGHCSGGLIAYEMSRQLKAQGKEVKLLAMFDTVAPLNRNEIANAQTSNKLHSLVSSIKRSFLRTYSKLDFELFLLRKHPKDAIDYKLSQIKSIVNKAHLKNEEAAVYEVYKKLTQIIENAHRSYKMPSYYGKIYVYFAKEHYHFSDMSRNVMYKKIVYDDTIKNRWLKYVDTASIFDIEGEHSTMFDPVTGGGKELAELLQRHLDECNKI